MLAAAGLLLVVAIPVAVGVPAGTRWKHKSDAVTTTAAIVSTAPPAAATGASAVGGASVQSASSLWQPKVGTSWQIVLSKAIKVNNGQVTPNVDVYDVDLFDTDAATISALKKAGKKVVCYFSAGSYEDWRPDAKSWNQADLGKGLDGWAGERWANVGAASVRNVMKSRIKMASQKGCDAIDPDNVDGYVSTTET